MKVFKFNIFYLIPLLFFSCINREKQEEVDDSDTRFRYFNLEKKGWKSKSQTQRVKNISYSATEVPIQYYILKDLGNTDLLKVDSVYEANKTERIIEFVFEEENQKDLLEKQFTDMDYTKSVEYISFKIQADFEIVRNQKDTVPCAGVLFERSFKVAPKNKIMLFFTGIHPDDKIQLLYQDNLYKNGTLKFQFKEPIISL